MFRLRRPSDAVIQRFLAASAELPLSYLPEGIALGAPRGFKVDVSSVVIGQGEGAFRRAVAALDRWAHFELGWAELLPRHAAPQPGTVVAVKVRHLGFWSLNGCRVLYRVGNTDGPEHGFAYGTLANHAECGEEIFQVRHDPDSGEVRYEIRAVSKPQALLARLGFPITRALQAKFRRDSGRAMERAVGSPTRHR